MNHAAHGYNIDQTVQLLPAATADPPNHTGGGSQRQRNKQDEAKETQGDKGALYDIPRHFHEIKKLIEPNVREKVQAGVKKDKQAQHAPELVELFVTRKSSQGGHAQGQHQKYQRPCPGRPCDEFYGIGAQVIRIGQPAQANQWIEVGKEYGDPDRDDGLLRAG